MLPSGIYLCLAGVLIALAYVVGRVDGRALERRQRQLTIAQQLRENANDDARCGVGYSRCLGGPSPFD